MGREGVSGVAWFFDRIGSDPFGGGALPGIGRGQDQLRAMHHARWPVNIPVAPRPIRSLVGDDGRRGDQAVTATRS
jgi:hypothetical protein